MSLIVGANRVAMVHFNFEYGDQRCCSICKSCPRKRILSEKDNSSTCGYGILGRCISHHGRYKKSSDHSSAKQLPNYGTRYGTTHFPDLYNWRWDGVASGCLTGRLRPNAPPRIGEHQSALCTVH